MAKTVHRPKEDYVINVVNQSARSLPISLIVIHDTEGHDYAGVKDLAGIGSLFNTGSVQASAHICVDGDGHTGRYVPDDRKAWHVGNFNSASLGIEQIGFASFKRWQWIKRGKQLHKVARWIAYWSKRYNIPIRRAELAAGVVKQSGVTTHAACSQHGSGTDHTDPGPNYPFGTLLNVARTYRRLGW